MELLERAEDICAAAHDGDLGNVRSTLGVVRENDEVVLEPGFRQVVSLGHVVEEVLDDLCLPPHGRGLIDNEVDAGVCHGQLGERAGARLGLFGLNKGVTWLFF